MEKLIRILPFADADGAHNMAADETLLHTAFAGSASLRFYGWLQPTVSLGYFQPTAAIERDPLLADLPFVRRPTGGATLVHHHEVTYALALPAPVASGESWLVRMHCAIARALAKLNVTCNVVEEKRHAESHLLCFQQFTPGDVLCGGVKVAGSAQRKARQCLLQHGAILLQQSPFAPTLPGIRERTGVVLQRDDVCAAIQEAFIADMAWSMVADNWSDEELGTIDSLKTTKYQAANWNAKR